MNALLFLPLVQPLIVAGVIALGLSAMAACWLLPLALLFGLLLVQAAAWSGLGFALLLMLLMLLMLPGFVLGALATLCYGGACWLLIELILSRPWEKTGGAN